MRWLSGLDGVLGGVLGHVAFLLAKNTKSWRHKWNTDRRAPDKAEEINNEPCEESENLDEDEGFKVDM